MKREIRASVSEIVSRLSVSELNETHRLAMRGDVGQEAHQQFLSRYPDSLIEYPLNLEYDSPTGWKLFLNGRADLIITERDFAGITEFKTVVLPPTSFHDTFENLPDRYLYQLKLYAYLLSKTHNQFSRINCIIKLLNLVDMTELEFRVDWDTDEVENFLEMYVEDHNRRIVNRTQAKDRRGIAASKLKWTHPSFREGQTDIQQCVTDVLNDGADLLIDAPTGSGKTDAILFPALKHALTNNKQIFYATAKTGGRVPVIKAIKQHLSKNTPVHATIVPPIADLCPERDKTDACYNCEKGIKIPLVEEDKVLPDDCRKTGIFTKDDILRIADDSKLCPVFISRKMLEFTDLAIGDYNFVFSTRSRLHMFTDENLSQWILLIDEAHNLVERLQEEESFKLSILETKLRIKLFRDEAWMFDDLSETKSLLDLFADLEERIDFLQANRFGETTFGVLTYEDWTDLLTSIVRSITQFVICTVGRLSFILRENLDQLSFELAEFYSKLKDDLEKYVGFADYEQNLIGLHCLDPSEYAKGIIDRFSNVIAFSGTLKPLGYYKGALGFGLRSVVEAESNPDALTNRKIVVCQNSINTRFSEREAEIDAIVEEISRFIAIRQGGYLVVFPSYEFLSLTAKKMHLEGVKILRQSSRSMEHQITSLMHELEQPDITTAALVTAGSHLTESSDLPGELCVGIVIVSPCLPPPDPLRELQMDYWDRRGEDGFAVAYLYPAIRRVVQAGGRLIRNENDFGAILLIGERFVNSTILDLLPADWQRDLNLQSGDWEDRVRSFQNAGLTNA